MLIYHLNSYIYKESSRTQIFNVNRPSNHPSTTKTRPQVKQARLPTKNGRCTSVTSRVCSGSDLLTDFGNFVHFSKHLKHLVIWTLLNISLWIQICHQLQNFINHWIRTSICVTYQANFLYSMKLTYHALAHCHR